MSKHLARVAKVDKIVEIEEANTINSAFIFGFSVIVSKKVKEGDIGLFLEAGDTQLSEEYCQNNNLYRHPELNKDVKERGYIEDNRRLKVQKFMRLHKSEGLFMPLSSLEFTGHDISSLKVGDAFDELNSIKICNKYFNEATQRCASDKVKKVKTLETPLLHKHCDTEQLAYYIDTIPVGSFIHLFNKWHGTSQRVANTKVIRNGQKFKFLHRIPLIGRFFWNKFKTTEESYEYVAGTRNVVLLREQTGKEGFHGPETFRFEILDLFKPYLEKNMTVYMEVVGYVNGSPIMPPASISKLKDPRYTKKYGDIIHYKYGCLKDQYKIKVYRISFTNQDGIEQDFTQAQLENWCEKRSINYAKPLILPFIYDGDKEKLFNLVVGMAEREDMLCEDYDDFSHICEGIVVSVESGKLTHDYFKYKTFPFKLLEGIVKESGVVDMEDAG